MSLYQIDNLNAVIETAKRILTKEKTEKQKTGQSSATPFMKASQEKSKKSEKGVLFGALETKETIDRHSTSIDKLTSLVNKLDMKLDFYFDCRTYSCIHSYFAFVCILYLYSDRLQVYTDLCLHPLPLF